MIKISMTLLLVLTLESALAQERSALDDFVLGNFEFVLLHELAHVVIGENDVPLLGPLESAADYTAIVMAIRGGGTSEEAGTFLNQALRDTATSFVTTWRLAESNGVAIPYWDVHALSIQRYYAALCLIYGSNSTENRELLSDLPQGRAAGCQAEYELADDGFQWLMDTYVAPVDKQTPLEISYSYGRVVSKEQMRLRAEIRDLGLLENTVNAVLGLFRPKAPMSVAMRLCGQPEAAWQPEKRELVICYELLDAFAQVHRMKKRSRS